jgi:hypothetical protein
MPKFEAFRQRFPKAEAYIYSGGKSDMYHRNYTSYLHKELDFLKLLVSRFHEQEKVNGLEMDVALQKMQEVYEQLLRIKLMPEPTVVAEKTITEPVQQPEPPQQPETPKKEPLHKPPTVEISPPEKVEVVKEEKKQPPEPVKASILAEKISAADSLPINETLAQQKTGGDLSSKLQAAPLTSIVSGIGLNDKFLYIRELFKGDNALYSSAVQHLDMADSLEDALDFINSHFDWDEKNETAQNFIALVHRRHGVSSK